ncbi:hypothetical protein [Comamonas composti]|uniref:hypothetical protein n=1 Tax=Comamonas composti TaxID=408558 RepID=UPI00047B8FDF|nr:hypothetical protein [Comamonas composti]
MWPKAPELRLVPWLLGGLLLAQGQAAVAQASMVLVAPGAGRCASEGVEFLVGGGRSAGGLSCSASAPAASRAGAGGRSPAGAAATRAEAGRLEGERRLILEQELRKEQQQASMLRMQEGGEDAAQAARSLRRHEANIAALQAELGRLP